MAAPAPRPSPRLLEIFLAVVEDGTMSAAGSRLGMSQAAVSQAVTQLEDILGTTLFDRSVRPPALTLVGNSVLRSARGVMASLRELEDAARHGASGRVPFLRLGMLDSFTSTAGASMLLHLKDVAGEWTVTSGFRSTSVQALLDRQADVIITSEERAAPGIVAQPLLTESFVLCAPKSYKGALDDIGALAAEVPFIRYGRDSHMGAVIQGYLSRAGTDARVRYQFDTTDAALRMVAAGFGWTIMTPLIYLKSLVAPNAVRVAPVPGKVIQRTLVVAMRVNEAQELLPRIHAGAIAALREVVQPQVEQLLPNCVQQFQIAGRPATRKRA
ncbi:MULTISPECIES: LysR family transcriptional regulator [Ramlibacter]|uniref:LysR family transcriptional regulator n=1 Tax=Ramlibacter pinisoli TaxID=2682844 RepID=A0A6N8IZC0_9BURK|nr:MULTISPECIES: LysR family transcriptional regulator [Ramlibacter]MBA2961992.1 LysR family transcriptional regulator [Ramlibacter sp. CGMCC 1.13660]MVQ31935.1 LysR family transcriptional regulator [Ramlibacter pinisoli]